MVKFGFDFTRNFTRNIGFIFLKFKIKCYLLEIIIYKKEEKDWKADMSMYSSCNTM